MLVKRTSKNQLTLPKKVADSFQDIVYFDVTEQKGNIILAPVRMVPVTCTLENIRKKMRELKMNQSDVARAVLWARKNRKQ